MKNLTVIETLLTVSNSSFETFFFETEELTKNEVESILTEMLDDESFLTFDVENNSINSMPC